MYLVLNGRVENHRVEERHESSTRLHLDKKSGRMYEVIRTDSDAAAII